MTNFNKPTIIANLLAATDLTNSSNINKTVKLDTNGNVILASLNDKALGTLCNLPESGKPAEVRTLGGGSKAKITGSVVAGDLLKVISDGKLGSSLDTEDKSFIVAKALENGENNDIIEIKPVFSQRTAGISPTSLKVWLDASDTGTIADNTGDVVTISDKSGEGNDFEARGTGTRTGDSVQNLLNVLDFDGTDGFLAPSAGDVSMTDYSLTVYMVAKVRVINNVEDSILSVKDIANFSNIKADNSTKFNSTIDSNMHSEVVPVDAPYDYNYFIYQYELDHFNNTATLYINGNQVGQATDFNTTLGDAIDFLIGIDNTESNCPEWSLGELRIYEGIPSMTDNEVIINDLKSKWAILSPKEITDILAHYDASNKNSFEFTGLIPPFYISSLNDLSNNSLNLTPPASAPETLANTLNNLNLINFDSSAYLSKSSFPTDSSISFFILAKVKGPTVNSAQSIFSIDNPQDDFQIDAGTTPNFRCQVRSDTLASDFNGGSNYEDTFRLFNIVFDYSLNTCSVYVDNVLQNSVNDYNTELATNGTFRLSANRGINNFIDQDFCEMIIVNRVLSTSERDEVYNYLKGKWAF
jgi:hypothetical protein